MNPRRATLAIILAIVGALITTALFLEHHGESLGTATVAAVCGEGAASGCETVARSAYSTLAGVPLAAAGLFFYLSLATLLTLALMAETETLVAGAQVSAYGLVLALVIDIVLLGIQAFALKAFCRLCLATYAVNMAMLFVLAPAVRGVKAKFAIPSGQGRLVLAGWVLASVFLAAGILSTEATLAYREARRAAGILGEPTSGGTQDAVQKAEAEAKRLQTVLDDPQKREQYLTEKAMKDFEAAVPQAFDLAEAPFSGPASAPIHVVEFSDYLCPFCRNLAAGFKDYLGKSGGRVAIHYKNYPLDKACNPRLQNTVHEGACWLALGAICAQRLGAFTPYQEKAYAIPEKAITRDDAVRLGTDIGLTGPAMQACVDAPATHARLAAEIDEAERAGVKATPTLYVDGKLLPRLNDFLLVVDKELARLGMPRASVAPSR